MSKSAAADHGCDGAAAQGERAAASRRGIGLSLPLALGLLVFLLGLATPARRLDDPDTMLHVVIGRWIIAHHAVPYADVFTHSMPGHAWVASSRRGSSPASPGSCGT